MMFKRVVMCWIALLMVIGMVVSSSAEYVENDETEIEDEAIFQEQAIKDTTTQTPIAFEGRPISMKMMQVNLLKQQREDIIKDGNYLEKIESLGIPVEDLALIEGVEKPEEVAKIPLEEGTIIDPNMPVEDIVLEEYEWEGTVINSRNGTVQGPNGKETYYNLPMAGVIDIMEKLGYSYEYSVREDGCKMYGPFIMVAADLDLRPRGSIIKTSRGWAMVCDTGSFTQWNPTQLDIAVDW